MYQKHPNQACEECWGFGFFFAGLSPFRVGFHIACKGTGFASGARPEVDEIRMHRTKGMKAKSGKKGKKHVTS